MDHVDLFISQCAFVLRDRMVLFDEDKLTEVTKTGGVAALYATAILAVSKDVSDKYGPEVKS